MSIRIAAAALAVLGVSGCALPTTFESTWTDPTFSGSPFGRIAVVGLFASEAENRTVEESAARALEAHGVDAVEAYTIVDDVRNYEQDELRTKLAGAGVDGILIYRLIAVDESRVYRSPTPYLHVPPHVLWGDPFYWYYYPHWDYYWYWRSTWDVTHSPEYWEPRDLYVVETSLYDAGKDRLVWTAKSTTMDGVQFESLAASIAGKVTDRLVASNLVGRAERDGTAARD